MSELRLLHDLIGGLDVAIVDESTHYLTSENRLQMAQNLKDWLITIARKKPIADLEDRMTKMGKRFEKLAESATFGVVNGEVVVKAAGENEDTLKKLENGTDWFDPCDNVVNVMISALWKS